MTVERITSRKNSLLQKVRKLTTSRKARYEEGLFVGDGTKLLEEAIRWYPGLDTVILTDGLPVPEKLPPHVRVYSVPEDVMESVSPMKAPQGAVFLCRLPHKQMGKLVSGCLILEGIQDPGNLGTILRTADALNIPVILSDGCADPYNWKTVRASMGAIFRTSPGFISSQDVIACCRSQSIQLATTALCSDSVDIRQVPLHEYAVVIGSEGQGVSPALLNASDRKVIIPMEARCESLNAAIAATIVMWQMKLGIKP